MNAERLVILLVAAGTLPGPAIGEMFSLRLPAQPLSTVDVELQREVVSYVQAVLDGEHSGKFDQFEPEMTSIFNLLPKNAHGRLDQDSVHYALHRAFSGRQGLTINGIQPDVEDQNATSDSLISHGLMSEFVQYAFAQRSDGTGFNLQEVAAMVGTIEHLIEIQMLWALTSVYRAKRVPVDSALRASELKHIMELYMVSFLQGHTVSLNDYTSVHDVGQFHEVYPAWPSVREVLEQLRLDAGREEFFFRDVVALLHRAGQLVIQLHHEQCQMMEGLLLDMEEGQTGRLPLQDFHHMAMYEGRHQFSEDAEALMRSGALDGSDANNPKLIIPNYLASRSNCIAQSSFFSVCCPAPCANILSQIEGAIGKDMATPTELVSAIEDIQAPLAGLRDGLLSPTLVRKLGDAARLNGGRLSLHGEPFAMWLHLLSPHACARLHSAAAAAAEVAAGAGSQPGAAGKGVSTRLAVEEDLFTRPGAQAGDDGKAAVVSEERLSHTRLFSVAAVAAVALAAVVLLGGSSVGSLTTKPRKGKIA